MLGYDEQRQRFVIECTDYRDQRIAFSTDATSIESMRLALERAQVTIERTVLAMVESDHTRGVFDGSVHHLSEPDGIYRYCIFDHPSEQVLSLNQLLGPDCPACTPVVFRPDASPLGWNARVYGQETKEDLALKLVASALKKGLIPRGSGQR